MFILAGKTLQVISFFLTLHERYAINGPHLVVMPLSVMNSWKGDLAKFINSDIFDVYTHHGEKNDREANFDEWLLRLSCSNKSNRIQLVLTSYEIAINDGHLLRRVQKGRYHWEYLVVTIYT
jgi:SNF2 family DNA or RNA helicase